MFFHAEITEKEDQKNQTIFEKELYETNDMPDPSCRSDSPDSGWMRERKGYRSRLDTAYRGTVRKEEHICYSETA